MTSNPKVKTVWVFEDEWHLLMIEHQDGGGIRVDLPVDLIVRHRFAYDELRFVQEEIARHLPPRRSRWEAPAAAAIEALRSDRRPPMASDPKIGTDLLADKDISDALVGACEPLLNGPSEAVVVHGPTWAAFLMRARDEIDQLRAENEALRKRLDAVADAMVPESYADGARFFAARDEEFHAWLLRGTNAGKVDAWGQDIDRLLRQIKAVRTVLNEEAPDGE